MKTVTDFWLKAGIPVRAQQHCIQKLKKIFTEWKSLLKHKSRTTQNQKTQEEAFTDSLDDLFDIKHKKALSLIKIPEVRV
jgi:predicted glycoside hydrolase/deacetylase ChbG (UPF0249 family)